MNKKMFWLFGLVLFCCLLPLFYAKAAQALSVHMKKSVLAENGSGVCCLDNYLEIGSFSKTGCSGDKKNLTTIKAKNKYECRKKTLQKKYRFADYYKTTDKFALVCVEPCSFNDQKFFDSSFVGDNIGLAKLKQATGNILPKQKMEIHPDKDGDCEYNEYFSGSSGYKDGHPFICMANYYWFKKLKGTQVERDYGYYEKVKSQTLTVHEPIHNIFHDYQKGQAPDYVIQESFCKAVSLTIAGQADNYFSDFFSGNYTLKNPPSKSVAAYNNFFVYSLASRFGFDENDMKIFFQKYVSDSYSTKRGNARVKAILDEILHQDTAASFVDLQISLK